MSSTSGLDILRQQPQHLLAHAPQKLRTHKMSAVA
jgi:hypothetical protein